MRISLIVAASEDNAIGKDNRLLWHLPNDLRFFKNTTWGMPVVMGRRTFDAIGRKPLPGRFNIVISRQDGFDPGSPDVWAVNSLEEALRRSAETNCLETFIAGGAEIYALAMPLATRLHLTRVHTVMGEADAHFPPWEPSAWRLARSIAHPADEKHAHAYTFETWDRV